MSQNRKDEIHEKMVEFFTHSYVALCRKAEEENLSELENLMLGKMTVILKESTDNDKFLEERMQKKSIPPYQLSEYQKSTLKAVNYAFDVITGDRK